MVIIDFFLWEILCEYISWLRDLWLENFEFCVFGNYISLKLCYYNCVLLIYVFLFGWVNFLRMWNGDVIKLGIG